MSANNWTTCPNCKRKQDQEQATAVIKAAKAYGKVPAEQYAKLLHAAQYPIIYSPSMREDYQLGVTEAGRFFVTYSASCNRCPFTYQYKYEVALDVAKLSQRKE